MDKNNQIHSITPTEKRIEEDVYDTLRNEPFLDASEIKVEVKGNEVFLSGSVDSRYSKDRAEDLSEDITGVAKVQNNLHARENTPQENRNNPNYNPLTSASANAPKNKNKTTNA